MGNPKAPRYLELGIRYSERKDSPPPGLTWIRTKKGDTLEKIAAGFAMRAIDLALMNYHTDKTDEINWYLSTYLGWTAPGRKYFEFTPTTDPNKGWILVPKVSDEVKNGPPQTIDAPRDGKAKVDSTLKVRVLEMTSSGIGKPVSGKWLYVFSGASGRDFGFAPPPQPPPKKEAGPDGQPGTAFPLRYPFEFYLKEKPDKLEYEIRITAQEAPDSDLLKGVTGKNIPVSADDAKRFGNKWHYLIDQAVLKNALSESRSKRTSHFLQDSKSVEIDLSTGKRYYFLLSPVQLGPAALKFAMDNPSGLTPLLRDNVLGTYVPPDKLDPDKPDQNIGPAPEDIVKNPIVLPVIDPYGLAENIAEAVYRDSMKTYIEWYNSKKNETTKDLHARTGWATLDHLFVAQMLKSVRDSHPKPHKIDEQLVDPARWKMNLETWELDLNVRHNEINAAVHRSLLWLVKVMEGAGHKIIETAILQDTRDNKPQDAIDMAHGIMHWAACIEYIFALEPGVVYLREALNKDKAIPKELVLKHFHGLDTKSFDIKFTESHLASWKYGFTGVLKLQALHDFISPPPAIPANLTNEERRKRLAEYNRTRRDNLIRVLNAHEVLPFKLKGLPLGSLGDGVWSWSVGSTAANAFLDASDKFWTWIITKEIEIPSGPERIRFLNRMADLKQWFAQRPTLAAGVKYTATFSLKTFAVLAGSINFYKAITTARHDYQTGQSTTTTTDKIGAVAGITLAIQDMLAELAALGGNEFLRNNFPRMTAQLTRLQVIFPTLMTSGGPTWGVGAARVIGVAGTAFAAINVLAMVTSGVVTIINASRGETQSLSRGDYTAAKFYTVGVLGGALMVGGGIIFGVALMQAGGAVSATGVGATVGVVLFFVGGLIAAISSIFASANTSDDYMVYARKCFLGKEGTKEPRFAAGSSAADPPDWSMASKYGTNTWEIGMQKKGLINLLSKFKLKTEYVKPDMTKFDPKPSIKMKITPGLFMDGNFLEVELFYKHETENTLVRIDFDVPDSKWGYTTTLSKGKLFRADDVGASKTKDKNSVKALGVTLNYVNHETKRGSFLTVVSMRNPIHNFVVRAKKLVDNDEIESGLFK